MLELPGLSLLPCKPCTRCPIPDIDPDTAVPGTSVGQSIGSYRQDPHVDGAITFGMNAIVLGLPKAEDASVQLALGQQLAGNLRFD